MRASTINSSIAQQLAADIYRYVDIPMGIEGPWLLITQLKKVVSESTPTPSQEKTAWDARI